MQEQKIREHANRLINQFKIKRDQALANAQEFDRTGNYRKAGFERGMATAFEHARVMVIEFSKEE